MSETAFTPGPWRAFLTTDGSSVIGIGEASTAEGIADCGFGVWRGGDAEAKANARLIAAAPEMFTALEALAACEIEDYAPFAQDSDIVRFPFTIAEVRAARAALAKARGETP